MVKLLCSQPRWFSAQTGHGEKQVFNGWRRFTWQSVGRGEIPASRFNGPEPGQCEDVLRIFWQGDQISRFAIFLPKPLSKMQVFAFK